MRKGFSLLALLVAIAAFAVAVAAFLRRKGCVLCDDLDDDELLELYDEDECGCCCCDSGADEAPAAPEAAAPEAAPEAAGDDEVSE